MELLRTGRQQVAAGKYAEAVVALEQCVKLAPADPTANAELGWAAFKAKDLTKAEAATRKALAGKQSNDQRAATLYNLGRIANDGGGSIPSLAPLLESYRLRPNEVVRAHLHLAQPTLADALDPYVTHAASGPFASIAAYCKAAKPIVLDDSGHDFECGCNDIGTDGEPNPYEDNAKLKPKAVKLAAPYDKVVVFTRRCLGNDAAPIGKVMELEVGVKLARGWFVTAIDSADPNSHGGVDAHVASVTATDVIPGDKPELVVDYKIGGNYTHHDDESEWNAHAVVVIGISASGVPSATHPIVLDQTGPRRGGASFDLKPIAHRTLTWNKDGTAQLTGDPDWVDKLDPKLDAGLRGRHAVTFK
jgi:hypothetical protein